ncbi:MAG: beta-galactosidase [Candidatus Limivivens sp.]|nr:beta-galactosidase [Candidatus Limivivens sp.]
MSERTPLFPGVGGLLHGGDYNPEQWLDRPDILEEDLRMMKKAHINTVTLGVFSWSVYEPVEGEFHFDWLEQIMDRLYENGIYTILATPTGARPAWLDEAYPDAMRVARDGVRNHHGLRHNHCMSSEHFRQKAERIDRKLAERFGRHPGLILWHVSNELGGECYCPACQERFRNYLRRKFDNDIEKLNQEWWTTFWSHRFTSFDQIEAPLSNGEGSIGGLNLEWKRFNTWNMTDYLKFEIGILKELTPDIPVTTNFMKLYPGLDYREMARELDVISWDSYPRFHNDYENLWDTFSESAFDHAVMRSLAGGKPFMLMESAPGLVNWHPFNKLKRPGIHSLAGLQALSCGSDTVQYFQWRKGRGSYEQYHGAVVDHLGRDDTRIFREVTRMGEELEQLGEVAGTRTETRAAILMDWDNRWAIQGMAGLSEEKKQYEKTCLQQYRIFRKLGIEADVVSMCDDLSAYAVVAAPMLYLLKEGAAENLKRYVRGGGQLVATYLTGYVNENTLCFLGGFPGDSLTELFGLYSEEIDTLYPSDRNRAVFADGETFEIHDFAEILKVRDAEVLASYGDDFYAGTPAVTCRQEGKGRAWYVGARISREGMEKIFRACLKEAGVQTRELPEGIEYRVRQGGGKRYAFYLNETDRRVELPEVTGFELLRRQETAGLVLEPFGAAVLRNEE